jgi:PAS domain S-box-containing protein
MSITLTDSEVKGEKKQDFSNAASTEKTIEKGEVRLKRQNEALIELAKRSWNTISLSAAVRSVTKVAAQTLDVARVSVWLYDDNRSKINLINLFELNENHHSDGLEVLKTDYPSYFAALESEENIVAVDAQNDFRTKEFSDSYLIPLNISSLLDIPIRFSGRTFGVLCVEHIGLQREWYLDEQNFARAIADVVSIILGNRERLMTEQALKKETALVELLKTVVVIANEAKGVEKALQICTSTICESLNWVLGAVFLQSNDSSPEHFTTIVCHANSQEVNEVLPAIDLGAFAGDLGLIDQIRTTGMPVWIKNFDAASKGSIKEIVEQLGIESGIAFPVTIQNKVVGVCTFFSKKSEESDPKITGILTSIGQQLGQVIERKRAEENLFEAKQFLHQVIDSIPNLIFVKDPQGRYKLANSAFAQIHGKTIESILGKTDTDFIKDLLQLEKNYQAEKQIIDNWDESVNLEEDFSDLRGNRRFFQTVRRPLFSDVGVEYILGISTDLTKRKLLEGQLNHAQKMESIGQLAAGIAHEINTPTQYVSDNLKFIQGSFSNIKVVLEKYNALLQTSGLCESNAELRREIENEIRKVDLEYLAEEIPNAIEESLEGVSRIANIVQSMKEFAHPGKEEKAVVDINRAIESTITVARNEWKYLCEMETRFDENLPKVPCLLGEFNQVILNLVINATHAIAEVVGDGANGKGKITVTTTNIDDKWAEVRISDTGAGIPPQVKDRIFEPFFTTKEVGKGTGQGLAISYTVIVEKHRGQLTFETAPGKGTVFVVRLPI